MAFLSKCISAFIILLIIETMSQTKDFNWQRALRQLRKNKRIWQRKQVNDYVFEFNPMCFCLPCYIEEKYITVESGSITGAEFADPNSGCSIDDYKPFRKNFDTIDGLYNKAIAHAKKGSEANCTTTANQPFPSDAICGGSVDITYDPILNYPLTISLNYGPFIADAGMYYKVSCLDVVSMASNTDLSGYTNACNVVLPPIDGDPNDPNGIGNDEAIIFILSNLGIDKLMKGKEKYVKFMVGIGVMIVLMAMTISCVCLSRYKKGLIRKYGNMNEYQPLLNQV